MNVQWESNHKLRIHWFDTDERFAGSFAIEPYMLYVECV